MKRFVVIAVLIALMAGAVYAQELKFDGYVNSGLGVVASDNKDIDPYLKAFGVDGESNGYRLRLNGSYTNEDKNAGVKFRLQSQRNLQVTNSGPVTITGTDINDDPITATGKASVASTYGYLSLPYFYGWVSFLENKVTLAGGIVDDTTWQTADWWFNDDAGEGLGLLLKATPIDGLDLGVGAYTISQQGSGNNNILTVGGNLPNFGNVMPKLDQAKYTFNAAYTMPSMFRLGLTYRPKNTAAWASAAPDSSYAYSGQYECGEFIGELRVLAVKDFTAVVVGVFDYVDDNFSDKGNITLSETFGYKLDSLNLGFNAVQFLFNRPTDYEPNLLFNLWGSYAIGKIVPRLDLVYFLGGSSKSVSSNPQWERRGFASQGAKRVSDTDDDLSVFSVRPSVKFNIDSKTFVELGDMINYDFGNYSGAYSNSDDANKKTQLTNIFYVDVKWSF